jgi:putative ABC transport system permease protein
MTILNSFRTALRGLTANKLRATLTALGIIIGVASVITMLALGNGARAAVDARFRHLGSDTARISVKQDFDDGEFQPVGELLTYDDGLRMTNEVPLVNRVEMSVYTSAKLRHGRNVLDTPVTGSTAALDSLFDGSKVQPVDWPEGEPVNPEDFVGYGRFFTPAEVLAGDEVCLLGHKSAHDLFDGENPLDQTIWVNRRRCRVIGVTAELEEIDPSKRGQSHLNDAFFLPISTAINTLYEDPPSVEITARVTDEGRMAEAKQQIANYLRLRHGVEKDEEGEYKDDFDVVTRNDILGARQEAAKTFSFLLTAMASVSLVVGGIGIMNVMLVSVTERTREIGVRLAVGARQRDIISQFMLEAMLISFLGGALGVLLGILAVPLAASLNQGVALLAPYSIPLGLGVAALTGMVFGLYPAVRASRLDPIEALRNE